MAYKLSLSESLQLSIAKRLSHILYSKQMTQKELAERIGVSAPTVSAWCNGTKSPRLDKIDKICEVLNITREELLGRPQEQQYQKQIDVYDFSDNTAITIEDIKLAQQINRLDAYRKKLIKSILETDPE